MLAPVPANLQAKQTVEIKADFLMSFSTKGPRKAADMPRMLIGHVIFVPLCCLFALRRTNNKMMVKYSVALSVPGGGRSG